MLPSTLALVDDDAEYREFLAQHLRERGMDVCGFADSNDLLAHPHGLDFAFYVLDLSLPGVDGAELIKVLRKRTQAGVVVVSGRASPNVFQQVVEAGADMYLSKPVRFEQVVAAITAVQRRAAPPTPGEQPWQLDLAGRRLRAPDGATVELAEADATLLQCLAEASGNAVSREALCLALGRDIHTEGSDGLNAAVFRLRRRIERATPLVVPLQSKSRVGYLFRAPLRVS